MKFLWPLFFCFIMATHRADAKTCQDLFSNIVISGHIVDHSTAGTSKYLSKYDIVSLSSAPKRNLNTNDPVHVILFDQGSVFSSQLFPGAEAWIPRVEMIKIEKTRENQHIFAELSSRLNHLFLEEQGMLNIFLYRYRHQSQR